ncbi:MAG: hypothetical protein U0903_11250 [Planctomycetales bacterium]
MNYFSHGYRFCDRPYFLAGTAIPDWLSIADRGVRMRSRRVAPHADGSGSIESEIAAGVLQHLHDDHWFHRTVPFLEVTEALTLQFRRVLPADENHRPSFLGHIVTELLLDAVLIERHGSELLERYYQALRAIDPAVVEQAVNRMARDATNRLAPLIPLFVDENFLWDYLRPETLWKRLNQVMKRIKLNPLPEEVIDVLRDGRTLVESRADDLLTEQISDPSE